MEEDFLCPVNVLPMLGRLRSGVCVSSPSLYEIARRCGYGVNIPLYAKTLHCDTQQQKNIQD